MKTPSEHFRKPVIGKIVTRELKGTMTDADGNKSTHILSSDEYEIIDENDDFVVTNQWHKEWSKIPLLIMKSLIETIEYDKDGK